MIQLSISVNSALSRNPIQFRKQEVDPYQQSFLRHTSYLHEYINDEDVSLAPNIALSICPSF